MALSPKQQRFVAEYMIDLNASAASRRAGYSQKNANVVSARLLANVGIQAAIAERQAKKVGRLEVSAEAVVREFARIAFSDLRRITSFGPDGVTLKSSDELHPDDAACVSEVTQTTSVGGGSIKIKLHNKVDALTKLATHLGLFKEQTPLATLLAAIPEPHRSDLIAALASEVQAGRNSRSLPAGESNAAPETVGAPLP